MILIVDQDEKAGSTVERVMRYRGIEAISVQSGMEALALMELRAPDEIVMDLAVGGMDGALLLQGIRKDPKFAKVPIVIYTADFADDVRRAALQNGAQDFIVKGTIGWEALVERIRRYLPEAG